MLRLRKIQRTYQLEVWYKEEKIGRAIIGFDIHWSTGTRVASATKKQIKELQTVVDAVFDRTDDYLSLGDLENLKRAIQRAREVEGYRQFTIEPISITSEYAKKALCYKEQMQVCESWSECCNMKEKNRKCLFMIG